MNLYADGSAEHFILTDPTFQSLEHCQESSYVNRKRVDDLANKNLGGPANVYCFSEESLREYLKRFATSKPIKKQQISY